jgi:hypothetical protein
LPEKQYKIIDCKPSRATLNAVELIKTRASRAITALTLCRELSDGFQYVEEEGGLRRCPLCSGSGKVSSRLIPESSQTVECPHCDFPIDPSCQFCPNCANFIEVSLANEVVTVTSEGNEDEPVECPRCGGAGEVPSKVRKVHSVDCPKDAVLKDILEDHEDVGRLVIYAGFSGSVDRCVELVRKAGWEHIRVDGRGWNSSLLTLRRDEDMVKEFQQGKTEKLAFIGQPGAAGMGLTLTASPTIFYFSNDFNFESRIQSEDRIHRPGMDVNRGATIIDCIHLPTDRYVLDNLMKKRRLQDLSLGNFKAELQNYEGREL